MNANAWPGQNAGEEILEPPNTRNQSGNKVTTPPVNNGNNRRASGYLIAVGSRTARFRRKHQNKLVLAILTWLLLVSLIVVATLSALYAKIKRQHNMKICKTKECLRSASNLALSMDRSANPCNDFYQFVCGNWAQDHPRPDAYRSYDWFRDKQTKVYTVVRDFLGKNTSNHPKPVQQAKDMYTACMDTDKMDERGLAPVIEVLKSLGLPPYPTYINITADFDYSTYSFDWLDTVIKVKTQLGMDVLIGFDIFTDPKNSSMYRLVMGSPEATNPFPSFQNRKKRHRQKNIHPIYTQIDNPPDFFKEKAHEVSDDYEKRSQEIFKLFYMEVIKMFVSESRETEDGDNTTMIDQNIIKAANDYIELSDDFYELESANDTDFEDYSTNLPEYTVDELQTLTDLVVESNGGTPTPIWKRYLEGIFEISDVQLDFENDKILVSEPDLKYMSTMAAYIATTAPVSLELYIWVKVVEVMVSQTTSQLRTLFQKSYEALQKTDVGVPPRSFQCASAVNDMMGMAVSYAIADPHFFNVTKPKIQVMLNEMKNVLARLVGRAKWMDDNTKVATYEKIIQMKSLIGFPDWLLEDGKLEEYYEGIEINVEQHLENLISVIQIKIRAVLNKFRNSSNITWATDPTEVNAYHTFQENTITVPLVMLQYPFYDLGLDSLNYGSLGAVLGHEITHGFDNFGRQFDKDGNLLQWWSNDTIESFVNMTHCFIEQYSSFYLSELDEYVDGKKTLGENIADNGGVREAFGALKDHLRKMGPEPKLPGFEEMTPEQLFFLSYGNLWCGISTRDSLKSDLDDEHSPQEVRARGALQNIEEFARAWKCPLGSAMNPAHKCIIF